MSGGRSEAGPRRDRAWAKDLLNLYDAIAEVLRGEAEQGVLNGLYERATVTSSGPAGANGPSSSASTGEIPRLVQEALRQLNNPAALSRCQLACMLPATLAATRSRWADGAAEDPTPLDQARAVREAVVSAIDRLKPAHDNVAAGAPEALQYHILREEYELKTSTRQIMTRYSISESTFLQNRREAVDAVARQLQAEEHLIAQGQR